MQRLLNDQLDELICVQFAECLKCGYSFLIVPGFYLLIGWIRKLA